MEIEYDRDKRATTLREPRLDFADAGEVFAGPTMTEKDTRVDYGQSRFITFGHLSGKDDCSGLDSTRHYFNEACQ